MRKRIIGLITLTALLLTSLAFGDSAGARQASADKKTVISQESSKKPADINWLRYSEGLELAKKDGKKIFIEFAAKWCGYCKKMRATTFKDSAVVALLGERFVSVTVDGDSRDTLNIDGWVTTEKKLTREFKVSGYPTFWFLTPEGEKIAPLKGYKDTKSMFDVLDYLKDDTYKTVKFQEFMEQKRKGK